MPHWELIDTNPLTGARKYIAADQHVPDAVLVKTEFDRHHTSAILEANKTAASDATGRMGDMVHAASIPAEVQFKWWDQYKVNSWSPNEDDRKRIKQLLNSSEWRYLKVRHIII
jgi:hypothetical protein